MKFTWLYYNKNTLVTVPYIKMLKQSILLSMWVAHMLSILQKSYA